MNPLSDTELTNAPVKLYWFNDRIEIINTGGPGLGRGHPRSHRQKSNRWLGVEQQLRMTSSKSFARFPWWIGIVAALASFLILNYVANLNVAAPRDIASLGTNTAQQIVKTIAWFGQYILPLLFLIGAVLSMIGRLSSRRLCRDIGKIHEGSRTFRSRAQYYVN